MKSKELADFAGVTVRALRHYHRLGLLPEPPRAENGYRAYGAADAARVLRIKRMASLGMPLRAIKDVFDAEGPDAPSFDEALDALDAELAEEIERLQARRREVRAVRRRGVDPDVPPAFGDHVARLRDAGASGRAVEAERSGLLLADRLLAPDSEEARDVARFFSLMAEADAVPTYVALNERLYALAPDASEEQRQDLADGFAAFLIPLFEQGKERYGWDISARSLSAISGALDEFDGSCVHAGARPGPCGSAATPRRARCGRDAATAVETCARGAERGRASCDLDAVLDLYDRETLSNAQRDIGVRVAKGLIAAFPS